MSQRRNQLSTKDEHNLFEGCFGCSPLDGAPSLDGQFARNGSGEMRGPSQTPPSYGSGRYGFGFFGPRIAFRATGALWGRATPFFYHSSVHLSSVLGRTELCHEVWTPGPQEPQIISNENHHLALLDCAENIQFTCSFCHLSFVKEFPRFGRNNSAKISKARLILAKIG